MKEINQLVTYGIERQLISERDAIYTGNQILYLLNIKSDYEFERASTCKDIDELLEEVASLVGSF